MKWRVIESFMDKLFKELAKTLALEQINNKMECSEEYISNSSGHFIYKDEPGLVVKEVYNFIKVNHIN